MSLPGSQHGVSVVDKKMFQEFMHLSLMDFVSSTGPLDANKETSTNHGTITLHNVETGSMKNWPNLPMQSTEVNSTK